MRCLLLTLVLSFATALALGPGEAGAAGGRYVFDGGTPGEQAQVRSALNASTFDWNLVPAQVTIHVKRGIMSSYASPGEIWLDADLLDAGQFSWGTIQMEYAHQVHFLLLDDRQRSELTTTLGARAWCWENAALEHADNGCERFAATLAWSYWPSPLNSMKPSGPGDESAALPPATFRALVSRLLGAPAPTQALSAMAH